MDHRPRGCAVATTRTGIDPFRRGVRQNCAMLLRVIVRLLRLFVLLIVIVFAIIFSLSNGSDYLHALGKTCLMVHHGWRVHLQCGVPRPPGF